MSNVILNDHRILEVNGEAFFPIAARHMPIGADPRILSEFGFNALRWTPFGVNKGENESYEVPCDLGTMMFYTYVYNRGDLSSDLKIRQRELTNVVTAIKDHPNLLCYEQLNEPAYTWMNPIAMQGSPEGMKMGSDVIRSLDPAHPIRVGHMCSNLVATLKKFNPAVGIISCNPYCINSPGARRYVGTRPDGYMTDHADRTLSIVGRYTDKMRRVGGESLSVWMQLQASANENWYNSDHTPETRDQGIYEHHRRYPSYWEMRFMAFNAIIHGATGLEWMLIRHPVDSPTFIDVRKVIGELRRLHDVLASPTLNHDFQMDYIELGFSDWEGVETLVKLHKGKTYIMAANTQMDPMIANFNQLPAGVGNRLNVEGENRHVECRQGYFTDRFQPYEVHVYSPESESQRFE